MSSKHKNKYYNQYPIMIAIHWHSIITTKLIDLRTWGSGENENIPVKFSNDQIKKKIKSTISNVYIIIHEKKSKMEKLNRRQNKII